LCQPQRCFSSGEAITLALVLAGFVALIDERWFLASVCIGASTAFRASSTGFTLGLCRVAVLVAWRRHKAGTAK